jgi:hypothetical protein
MDERWWLSSQNPDPMTMFLRTGRTRFDPRTIRQPSQPIFPVSQRKWMLFYCACARRIQNLMHIPAASDFIEVADQFAQGIVTEATFTNCAQEATLACDLANQKLDQDERRKRKDDWEVIDLMSRFHQIHYVGRSALLRTLRRIRTWACEFNRNDPDWKDEDAAEMARQASLLREIVGNPFRPCVVDLDWLVWHDGTIRRMAQRIYAERRFEGMPILADALEDAGCYDEAILRHCRAETIHVRGCWLLDLLLSLN